MLAMLTARQVRLRGATAENSDEVNGVFTPTGELYNGKLLLRKETKGPERWLLYAKNHKWLVTDTAEKEANGIGGWCFSEEAGLAHPALAESWVVLVDEKWETQPNVRIAPSDDEVIFSPLLFQYERFLIWLIG